MFDVGFSEILVIAVVALIVIGPEKLPKTARTLGHLFGRLQRYVADVKSDINREMELDELRKLREEVKTAAGEFESSVTSAVKKVESSVQDVEAEVNALNSAGNDAAQPHEMQPLTTASAAEGTASADAADTRASLPAPITHDPAPAAGAHDYASTAAVEPPRQATLPGLDRG